MSNKTVVKILVRKAIVVAAVATAVVIVVKATQPKHETIVNL